MDAFVPIFAAILALSGSIIFGFVGPKMWEHFYNKNERSLKDLREHQAQNSFSKEHQETLAEIAEYRQMKLFNKLQVEHEEDQLRDQMNFIKAGVWKPVTDSEKRYFNRLKKKMRKIGTREKSKTGWALIVIAIILLALVMLSWGIATVIIWGGNIESEIVTGSYRE